MRTFGKYQRSIGDIDTGLKVEKENNIIIFKITKMWFIPKPKLDNNSKEKAD